MFATEQTVGVPVATSLIFFASSFTDARQSLLQLYESVEFSQVTIDENL